jgi:hypothetical protein
MKMIITYLAGFISAGALILSFINNKLVFGFAISIPVTILAFVFVHKVHKKKQKEYYNRFNGL